MTYFLNKKLPERTRLIGALKHLLFAGHIQKKDICIIGEISMSQAVNDVRTILREFPGLMHYEISARAYVCDLSAQDRDRMLEEIVNL